MAVFSVQQIGRLGFGTSHKINTPLDIHQELRPKVQKHCMMEQFIANYTFLLVHNDRQVQIQWTPGISDAHIWSPLIIKVT